MPSIQEIVYHHTDNFEKMEYMLSCFSHVRLCVTLWSVACQTPLSMGFSRQEFWSGFLCPSPRGFPNPEIEPTSLMYPTLATPGKPPRWLRLEVLNVLQKLFKIYSSPPPATPQPVVSLSEVSVTCGQPWSKNIKWEIPEINNSRVVNCMVF